MKMELNRRNFLKGSTAALGAAALPALAKEEPKLNASADTVILCWMAGGMASTETFDPKRYTPFEKELKSDQVLSFSSPLAQAGNAAAPSAAVEPVKKLRRLSSIFM